MQFRTVLWSQILSILIVVGSVRLTSAARTFRKVLVHVPMKVKHHHHTHTVFKHVHHQVPIHYDHQDVHVIHPETHEEYDLGDYHISHGRMLDSIRPTTGGHDDDYENFERYLRKRSKSKQKLFNNMLIGWKGRSDFDKIANEYLASIRKQRTPESDDYQDQYSAYDDDDSSKKRKWFCTADWLTIRLSTIMWS